MSVIPPLRVAAEGDTAVFNCLDRSGLQISGVRWILNGLLVESLHPTFEITFSRDLALGTLFVNNVTAQNNAVIRCIASVDSEEIMSTNEARLLVQGMVGE